MSSIKERAERNGKVRRTISKIEQTIAKLERMKDEYLRKATEAKARGESGSYSLAKSGLNATLSQIKRAKEMLLNIEITAELQKMGDTNADFLTGMSTIAKRISKINKQSDFVKLQKEINKALSGMEEAQAGLDGFLLDSDAAFAAISSASGSLTDEQIDRLVDGRVSEKELLMDEQIERLMSAQTPVKKHADGAARENVRVRVGDVEEKPSPSVAKPFPSPNGVFDFRSEKKSPNGRYAELETIDEIVPCSDEIECVLGSCEDGAVSRLKLSQAPHILIGGILGSGKSNFIHRFICSLMLGESSENVRLLMFDFKCEELLAYNGVAQLAADVITDVSEVAPTLAAVETELNERYELFARLGVRDIESYNIKAEKKLPYVVVIFDEFGDIMKTAGAKSFESAYTRLSRQSAGAGIFTVLCTRHVDSGVITPSIAAATDAALAFKVGTKEAAELLSAPEAIGLKGTGDFVFDGKFYTVPRVSETTIARIASAFKGDIL